MPAINLPAFYEPPDIPSTPEERLREVAAILAAGVLRLRTHPQLAATSDIPGEVAAEQKSEESSHDPLGFSALMSD